MAPSRIDAREIARSWPHAHAARSDRDGQVVCWSRRRALLAVTQVPGRCGRGGSDVCNRPALFLAETTATPRSALPDVNRRQKIEAGAVTATIARRARCAANVLRGEDRDLRDRRDRGGPPTRAQLDGPARARPALDGTHGAPRRGGRALARGALVVAQMSAAGPAAGAARYRADRRDRRRGARAATVLRSRARDRSQSARAAQIALGELGSFCKRARRASLEVEMTTRVRAVAGAGTVQPGIDGELGQSGSTKDSRDGGEPDLHARINRGSAVFNQRETRARPRALPRREGGFGLGAQVAPNVRSSARVGVFRRLPDSGQLSSSRTRTSPRRGDRERARAAIPRARRSGGASGEQRGRSETLGGSAASPRRMRRDRRATDARGHRSRRADRRDSCRSSRAIGVRVGFQTVTQTLTDRGPVASPSICSGAMYAGVPSTAPVVVSSWGSSPPRASPRTASARPKSPTCTDPSAATSTLSGLKSRCTTPARCAAASPSPARRQTARMSSAVRGAERYPRRLSPSLLHPMCRRPRARRVGTPPGSRVEPFHPALPAHRAPPRLVARA